MATVSFDEKVIVTDPQTVTWMIEDLDSTTPVVHNIDVCCTIEKTDENGRKWATKLLHSLH